VVYGFFAALTVGPAFRAGFNALGAQLAGGPLDGLGQYLMQVQNQMALVAGAVMGIMLIPFVSSLSDDIINAVPQSLRDGSLAMGATKSETVKKVVLPAALPGVMAALLLAVSRAVGETMIVTMAAGLQAKITLNPLDTVTTVTVQIVTLLTGDQEFDSPKTLAAFGLGLTLFAVTLALNIVALRIVRKYREQYD
jgi:phosphate transport system permease protein